MCCDVENVIIDVGVMTIVMENKPSSFCVVLHIILFVLLRDIIRTVCTILATK